MLNYNKSHFLVLELELLNASTAIGCSPVLAANRTIHELFIRGHLIVQQV